MSSELVRHSERFLARNTELLTEASERDITHGNSVAEENSSLEPAKYGNAFLVKELAKSIGAFQTLVDESQSLSGNEKEVGFHVDRIALLSEEVTRRNFSHSVKVTQGFSEAFQKYKAEQNSPSVKAPSSPNSAGVTIKINAPNLNT